jgi:hypothetical protein
MRVASSIACALDQRHIAECLQPIQLGMGVAGGAEAMAWIARQHLAKGPGLVISFDEKHAFQYVNRSVAVNRTIEVCEASARLVAYEYRFCPIVHFAHDGQSWPLTSETRQPMRRAVGAFARVCEDSVQITSKWPLARHGPDFCSMILRH